MSLLIFTQWPSCVRPYFWQPMHQEFSAVGEAICVYFPLRVALSSPLSHLASSRVHFTLYVSINYSRTLKRAYLTDEQQGTSHTVLTDLYLPACQFHIFSTESSNSASDSYVLESSNVWHKVVKLKQYGKTCLRRNTAWCTQMGNTAGFVWFNARFMG